MVKAAVIAAPGGPVEVREFAEPELEPGGAVLETLYSEVCGTDVHLLHGRLPGVPYPLIPGHLSVGRLAETNGPLCDVEGRDLSPGDVVTFLDVHGTCHSCWYCLVAKASTRCPSRRVYGITYGAEEGLLGGWSERIYLKPGVRIVPLPEGLDPLLYMAGGCALPTALHAIDRADVKLGANLAVQGSGPVGLMAAALARLSGAGTVIVLGAPRHRLDVALALGADHAIDIEAVPSHERPEAVRALTGGRGADITIECTGEPRAIPEGLRMTRDAGTYVVVGQYTDAGEVALNPHADLNRKHLDVRACWGIDLSHLYRAVQLLARHRDRLPWSSVISGEYPLAQAAQALRDVEERRAVKAVINPRA
ncbi:MAG: zinc-binding dehydrogenase [Armatimonadetes bacterium]|nr:zinc-binding dehydrogenase [Armatimonadota bacterium]